MRAVRFLPAVLLAALAAAGARGAEAPASAALPVAALVDGFEDPTAWSPRPADGVELTLHGDAGLRGRSLRLDFRFVGGGGYAVVHRDLALELPANYRFRFAVRGTCQPQNLEFKLIDASGENVWWSNQRDFAFPSRWDSVTLKRRQITFAWGPGGGGEIRHVAAIEFAVTAGSGGSGSVWLDELTLEPLPPPGAAPPPVRASASSSRRGHRPEAATDPDAHTFWWSGAGDSRPALTLDLGVEREFGGLTVDWVRGLRPRDYVVETSADGAGWRTLREVRGGARERDYLDLPESEARFLRLRAPGGTGGRGIAIGGLSVEPLAWAASPADFFRAVAADAPRGCYPRGIRGEPSAWTVVGVDGADEKALLGQDGALETGKGACSVEPFLFADGRLVTWADVRCEPWLEEGCLPIPTVRWHAGELELTITAFADGPPRAPTAVARYRVRNLAPSPRRVILFLALRPFQVNPPAQFLNTPGGVAPVRGLALDGRVVRVNADHGVVSLTAPAGFGAARFEAGDIVADFLRQGRLPPRSKADDPRARASGALAYRLDLAPGAEQEVDLEVPLVEPPAQPPRRTDAAARAEVVARLSACRRAWRERLDRVGLRLPPVAVELVETLRAQAGWILVNRHGAAIQPGSRSYDRSWIRDGALTSSALLRLGHPGVVRDFIEWFARFQYADGKVPCCVDRRGADPVPENDSNGEFIFLVGEYLRYTGDRALAGRLWPAAARAAAYLDSLRAQRRTAAWRAAEQAPFFGLLPPSISHEGYSAKPMHSYWDDLFALRGYQDAVYLARALDRAPDEARLAAARDQFRGDLAASVRAAMARHRIDYVPGCADLGDFDATSTAIALDPVQAGEVLPRAALERTFERYWEFFRDRRDGAKPWEAFTPYEMRTIGAFVRLGWRERADSLLQFFMRYRTPPGWRQWPEVAWHDTTAAHFVGDLPHTWVGSDFVRSVLDMIAYPREADSALVLAAGVPLEWIAEAPGLAARGLPTPYGPLTFTLRANGQAIEARIEGDLRVPRGGIVLNAPGGCRRATVNGQLAAVSPAGELVLRSLPATVVLTP